MVSLLLVAKISFLFPIVLVTCVIFWTALNNTVNQTPNANTFKLLAAKSQVNQSARNIFFVAPTGSGQLSPRQACAVESAARANPNWWVHVFFTKPITDTKGILVLKQFKNIKFSKIKPSRFIEGTIYSRILYGHPNFWNNSEILRLISAYKFGGIFLDMDILVVKSLSNLAPNWVVRMPMDVYSGSIFAFDKNKYGRELAAVASRRTSWIVHQMKDKVKLPKNMVDHVITNTVMMYCTVTFTPSLDAPENCPGLSIYNHTDFPLNWESMKMELVSQIQDLKTSRRNQPYVFNMKQDIRIYELIDHLYPRLAEKYCPLSYKNFGNNAFGSTENFDF